MVHVVIVGAGPAGMFCAYELARRKIDVTLVEKGHAVDKRACPRTNVGYCTNCKPCNYTSGVGGSGTFSDGKLNLDPEIGGNMLEFLSPEEANRKIAYVDEIFVSHGADGGECIPGDDAVALVREAKKVGVKFIPIHQRHIGSDKLPEVVKSMEKDLKSMGVKLITDTEVADVLLQKNTAKGVVIWQGKAKREIRADYTVLAPGRGGARWLADLAKRLNLPARHQPLDVGVRVEVPNEIMEEITKINYDPKFHIQTKTHDDHVRTFCTNPGGFVISESYGDFVCANGHAMRGKKSKNTNFAFLARVALTEPVENTTEYGEAIGRMATNIGGGKVVIQRLRDLKKGRRSTWERLDKSYVEPSFRNVTPGDISMTLPGRIVVDMIEGLETLNKLIPGVDEDSTLLYSPEIKFHALRVETTKRMETIKQNLFAVGDGAGVSRGIVGAAVTGLIAADEIISRKK